MPATTNFLAADLGASNGRVLLARWDGARFALQELHRFPNGPTAVHDRLYGTCCAVERATDGYGAPPNTTNRLQAHVDLGRGLRFARPPDV